MRVGCQVITRRDFEVKNDRDLMLQCSMWEPIPECERGAGGVYKH